MSSYQSFADRPGVSRSSEKLDRIKLPANLTGMEEDISECDVSALVFDCPMPTDLTNLAEKGSTVVSGARTFIYCRVELCRSFSLYLQQYFLFCLSHGLDTSAMISL